MFLRGIRPIPREACAVLLAPSRPWQARGDAVREKGSRKSAGYERRGSRGSRGSQRMSLYFEELDFRPTPMGVLSLRRRRHLASPPVERRSDQHEELCINP